MTKATRRFGLAALAGALSLLALVAWWNLGSRTRMETADGAVLDALAAEFGSVLWLARPHQNLGAFEEAMGDLEKVVPAAAGLFGVETRAVPRFGPFAAPPAVEMVLAFSPHAARDAAGAGATGGQMRARFGPVFGWALRSAGRLAGNPWLEGGLVTRRRGDPTGRVEWVGSEWRYQPISAPIGALDSIATGAHPAEAERVAPRPLEAAVAWWVIAAPIDGREGGGADGLPAPGHYRLARTPAGDWLWAQDDSRNREGLLAGPPLPQGLAALLWIAESGETPAAGAAPPHVAREDAIYLLFAAAEDSAPGRGRPIGSFGSGLPALGLLRPPGSNRRLPAEDMLESLGAVDLRDRPSGWTIAAYDRRTADRVESLAEVMEQEWDRFAAARLRRRAQIEPAAAVESVRRLRQILDAIPFVAPAEVEKLEHLELLLAAWPPGTRILAQDGVLPGSFRLEVQRGRSAGR